MLHRLVQRVVVLPAIALIIRERGDVRLTLTAGANDGSLHSNAIRAFINEHVVSETTDHRLADAPLSIRGTRRQDDYHAREPDDRGLFLFRLTF